MEVEVDVAVGGVAAGEVPRVVGATRGAVVEGGSNILLQPLYIIIKR